MSYLRSNPNYFANDGQPSLTNLPGNGTGAAWPTNDRSNPAAREPIAPSSLNFRWPCNDPETVVQTRRLKNGDDWKLARMAATSLLDANADRMTAKTRGLSPAERVQRFFADSTLNFNPVPPARDNLQLRGRFEAHTRRNAPIPIVYPLFACIGNWAKHMYNDGLTMAEEITIRHFLHLNEVVRSIYEPGLRFIFLCDARLYNPYLSNPEVVVCRFMHQLEAMVGKLDDQGIIELNDYAGVLEDHTREFRRYHAEAHRRMRDDLATACPGINLAATFQSLRASIYTKHLGMGYSDYVQTFSTDRNPENPYHRQLDELGRVAYAEMMAIRFACYSLESTLFASHWPDAIRVTCHVAHDPQRPMIGLRPYPDYKRSSQLLPYHGTPVLYEDNGRLKMAVHPEVRLRAHPDLVRVTHEDGETYFYSGLEAGIRGNAQSLSARESQAIATGLKVA
jgi:L-tyrosine isonitrile synthase